MARIKVLAWSAWVDTCEMCFAINRGCGNMDRCGKTPFFKDRTRIETKAKPDKQNED